MTRLLNSKSIFPLVTKAEEAGAKLPFRWSNFQHSVPPLLPQFYRSLKTLALSPTVLWVYQ